MRIWSVATLLFLALGCRATPSTDKTPDETDTDTDADSDADSDTDADTDSDTELTPCPTAPDPTGAWPDHPIALAGAAITTTPYSFDAGVQAVRDAAIAAGTTNATVSLAVTGAIVTARAYVPAAPTNNTATFWFEDVNGPMQAYIVDVGFDPNNLKPGDEVSFTATEVVTFFGVPEVTAISGFTVDSTANDVHVSDGNDGLTMDDLNAVVNLWGQLTTTGSPCGGDAVCFDMTTAGGIELFRTESTFDVRGDCIHYIGPISTFDGAPQINATLFDWYYYY